MSDYLHSLFLQSMKNVLSPDQFIPRLVAKKFAGLGVELTKEQLKHLAQQVKRSDFLEMHLELNKEQECTLVELGISPISINLDDIDIPEEKIREVADSVLWELVTTSADVILDNWKSRVSSVLALERAEQAVYLDKIVARWETVFDFYEALISICTHLGAEFNEHLRNNLTEDNIALVESITRIHARGCQVANEILVLARNGFADGAHARWRTLHELTTIAQFIKSHGNQLAQRYLDYSAVIDNDLHKSYEQYYEKLGYAAPKTEDVQEIKEAYNNVIQKYEKEFGKSYGWAAAALNDKSPTFSKIEQAADVSHMRPFYKLANMNVHADSKSISFRLGLPPNVAQILVVGRSMFGLAEPIQNAAYSINNLTGALLLLEPNVDRLAAMSATTQLVSELFVMVDKMEQEQKL